MQASDLHKNAQERADRAALDREVLHRPGIQQVLDAGFAQGLNLEERLKFVQICAVAHLLRKG